MHATLRHLLRLWAGVIFFSNISFAVCAGSSHTTDFAGYALSPDSSRIAAIAEDGALFWWDVASGKRTELVGCIKPRFLDHPILFSPDSSQLAVATERAVQVFEISSGKVIARLTSRKLDSTDQERPDLQEPNKIVFSGDGLRLAASYEAGVVVWEVGTQAEIASISVRGARRALALNFDGTLLAVGSSNGLELWSVPARGAIHILAEGAEVESALFVHEDQWVVALTAIPLPPEPKQLLGKYKREIAVWDSSTGKKLKILKNDAELDELRFGLTSGGSHLLLAVGFQDWLRAWDIETGELKATWRTSSGHPSGDGKLLLRDGAAPGQLELWRIGGPDQAARAFTYRSPLCASSYVDDKGNLKLEGLFIADGISEEDQPFGSLAIQGYVAQDCSRLNVTRLTFGTEERAIQELDQRVAQAIEVIEKGPRKGMWQQAMLGERRVLRFPGRGSVVGPFAVIWIEGTSLFVISSSSLPLALAKEEQMLRRK